MHHSHKVCTIGFHVIHSFGQGRWFTTEERAVVFFSGRETGLRRGRGVSFVLTKEVARTDTVVYKYRKMTITLGFVSEIEKKKKSHLSTISQVPIGSNYCLHHIFIRSCVKYINFISCSFTPSLIILLTKS